MIYLDSCIVIYAVEQSPLFATRITQALKRAKQPFAISPLVVSECLVAPLKRGDAAMGQRFEAFFVRSIMLSLVEADFRQAAQLRAQFSLRTPDALHVACAARHGCTQLWTNDQRLDKVGRNLVKNILR